MKPTFFPIFAAMKTMRTIIGLAFLLAFTSCHREPWRPSAEAMQEAQAFYDSGFVLLQQDSLLQAFPHFVHAAGNLEYLPEDMTDEEMLLASRAYYQMAYVFGRKIENNAEIDALRWALAYQKQVDDTTWMVWTSRTLANAFENVKEIDSARFYLDWVMPHLDTTPDNVWDYIDARHLLASLYLDGKQLDSCLMVQRETIAFKQRRGMDTKGDSVSIGMNLFFSDKKTEAKPYLLKVMDDKFGDVERGAVMSLLAGIYEEENNADSAAFCQRFHSSYVQAESERVSDGLLAVKQYENYKTERDARLSALHEQKTNARRRGLLGGGLLLVAVIIGGLLASHRNYRKKATLRNEQISRDLQEAHGLVEAQAHEALQLKVQAIYDDKRGNNFGRIQAVFNEAYPDALARLKAACPDLSETELDICVLSLFPFRTKEIADILDLRENTVSKYRTAIRKKTQADSFEALWERFIG